MVSSVCVVGGGINGAGIAWELVRKGYEVTLFEQGWFGGATSSATTKMIHGGLRYLETADFRLVRESLRERAFLLEALPDLVRPLPIVIPIYEDSPRSPLTVRAGLLLYDMFAGNRRIARSRRMPLEEILQVVPLRRGGMQSGFLYHDAQVDDRALVRRVIDAAIRDGLEALEHTEVVSIARKEKGWSVGSRSGSGVTQERSFDVLVNAVGPWMNEHIERFQLASAWRLSLIRGSHLILNREPPGAGALIQSDDGRVVFVLPWKGTLLVGTTEVPHQGSLSRVTASTAEIDYLLAGFNRYFAEPARPEEILDVFSGVRPLVASRKDPSRISRESRVEVRDGMVNVFGGKLTTFMALARDVGRRTDRMCGRSKPAAPPVF